MITELAAQDVLAAIANDGVTMRHSTHRDTIVDGSVTCAPPIHNHPDKPQHPDGPHPPQGTLKRSPNLLRLRVSCAVARCNIRAPRRWRMTEQGHPGLDGPLLWPTQRIHQQGGHRWLHLYGQFLPPPVTAPVAPQRLHTLRVAHNVLIPSPSPLASRRLLAPPPSPSTPSCPLCHPSRPQAASVALQYPPAVPIALQHPPAVPIACCHPPAGSLTPQAHPPLPAPLDTWMLSPSPFHTRTPPRRLSTSLHCSPPPPPLTRCLYTLPVAPQCPHTSLSPLAPRTHKVFVGTDTVNSG
ncbi:hypothetical protein K439DRAFT_1618743 [Ramaria rubella]|nr:hypothetical protein K439DRAFT_1618743 [Ramaria rubella]